MEIVICAIARLENRYIKEWIDYHLDLGFSHIYLYDNNRVGEEQISDIIEKDSSRYKGRLTLIPYHDVENWPQMQAYGDCWEHRNFDWVLFIDIDEFFTFGTDWKGERNIHAFVNKYEKNTDAILLNWMCFGDNGHLQYENKPVTVRFPKPLPLNFSLTNIWGKQPENGHVKTLIHHTADFHLLGPHVGKGNYSCCNADGKVVENTSWQPHQTYSNAYIRHYVTKSISEYLDSKTKRSLADRSPGVFHDISSFFKYNKPTIWKIYLYKKTCKERNVAPQSFIWWIKQWIKQWIITPLFVK